MADGCGHQGVMEELNGKIEKVLEEYTLADLSRKNEFGSKELTSESGREVSTGWG